jgi:hypothetical protein
VNSSKWALYINAFLCTIYSIFCSIIFSLTISFSGFSQVPTVPFSSDSSTTQEHISGSGFLVKETDKASLTISLFPTIRYLNQLGLDEDYVFSNGDSISLDRRNDIQVQKVMIYFKGWLADPKFRYLTYIWSANTSQGLGAQVVVGGNLQYQFNKFLDLGVGIGGLPTSRAMYGQWPFWIRQDARVMSEEFFRGSFTTGIWLQGELAEGLFYKAMLGNNLSQLGVDAGQLDNGFDTFSGALWWTTGNFGRNAPFGDYEHHEKLATMIGSSYSRSNETPQSQPGTQAPENSQLRFSDGRLLFSPGSIQENSRVLEASYQMHSMNAGLKYKGLSFSAEYYTRWLDVLESEGSIADTEFFDQGWYLKGSYMLIKKTLMVYAYTSQINGEFGNPYDVGMGLNWYVFKSRFLRLNPEFIYVENSPVGYLSYPLLVGARGPIFMFNLEIFY